MKIIKLPQGKMKNKKKDFFSKRLKILSYSLAIVIVIIIFKLINLQIINFEKFSNLSKRNFTRVEKIYSPRGDILDCKGRPLATNRPTVDLYWKGTGNKKFSADQEKLLQHLRIILTKELLNEEIIKISEFKREEVLLEKDLRFDVLRCLIEQYPNHKNITLRTEFRRSYPYSGLAGHILGYLGSTRKATGKMGIEKIFNKQLEGKTGKITKKVNSKGVQINKEESEPEPGDSLMLTIDLDLQKIAEKIFPRQFSGTIIVMNSNTGALRVVLSNPTFNPNLFTKKISQRKWRTLQKGDKTFLNRAFSAMYPPASLFKLITAATALETDIINQDTKWECEGHIIFGKRKYCCNNRKGHGVLDINKAIASSCNIPFFEIGKKIKIDTLAAYAEEFGLGKKTNKIFSESSGLVPSFEWKLRKKKELWWQGETLLTAIGQSFLLVTPIQMARMIAAICQGFLVTPSIIASKSSILKNKKKYLNIKEETRIFLKKCLSKSIEEGGTVEKLGNIDGMEIHAKTGTAQTVSHKKKYSKGTQECVSHAWITLQIKYKKEEPFVLLILLEHGGSSVKAVKVAKDFIAKYRELINGLTGEN